MLSDVYKCTELHSELLYCYYSLNIQLAIFVALYNQIYSKICWKIAMQYYIGSTMFINLKMLFIIGYRNIISVHHCGCAIYGIAEPH